MLLLAPIRSNVTGIALKRHVGFYKVSILNLLCKDFDLKPLSCNPFCFHSRKIKEFTSFEGVTVRGFAFGRVYVAQSFNLLLKLIRSR